MLREEHNRAQRRVAQSGPRPWQTAAFFAGGEERLNAGLTATRGAGLTRALLFVVAPALAECPWLVR